MSSCTGLVMSLMSWPNGRQSLLWSFLHPATSPARIRARSDAVLATLPYAAPTIGCPMDTRKKPAVFQPDVYEVKTFDEAMRATVTPEEGTTTEERWRKETPYLGKTSRNGSGYPGKATCLTMAAVQAGSLNR